MMDKIADIRKDYRMRSFSEADASADPFEQFSSWWEDAVASNIEELNAMALATVNAEGKPSARIVLLKGMNENGFEFYTNYESHKADDIAANKNAALVFFWKELERQVRIEGIVEKTSAQTSDEYFNSRPEQSRIGAWASPQSHEIGSRGVLEEKVNDIKNRFKGKEVTRPPFWGGYIVKPVRMEFWQGRPSRLHDRIEYNLQNGAWVKRRLAP
jgi:pyridoxamine 5'-phosphate oxidase